MTTDSQPKSLQEAEQLLRRRPTPRWDDRPPPEAVTLWRELRSWDGKCTCPPAPPWRGGAFDSSDPVHRERRRLEPELLRMLGLRLKPWQEGIDDFPDVVAALNEARAGNGSERLPPNRD